MKAGEEDEIVGWHHQFNGHKLWQTRGDGDGQGGPASCSPWDLKESDTTWQLKDKNILLLRFVKNIHTMCMHAPKYFHTQYNIFFSKLNSEKMILP